MEVGNVTKVATFKSFLHANCNYFFVTVLFNISHEKNINRLFLGVTQKYELPVCFKFSPFPFRFNGKESRKIKLNYLEAINIFSYDIL